jgi:hypothetical protein
MIESVMKVGRLLGSPIPILLALLCPGQQPTGALQVRGYDAIRSSLSSRTSVPVRLPTFIPPYADNENPIYAIVDSAGPNSYSIQLAWAEDCKGGNWCHLGEITGSQASIEVPGPMTPVAVSSGISGCFVKASVGAYCSDAMVFWNEGSYHYRSR